MIPRCGIGDMALERLLDHLWHIVIMCLLVAASGAISASETALFALTRQQLKRFRQSGRWMDQLVLRLRETPESLISTVLLANMTVNILLYSILAITVGGIAGPSVLWTTVLGVIGFLLVLFAAEVVPKLVAFAVSERLAPLVAIPLRLLEIVTLPLRWLLNITLIEPFTRVLGGGGTTDQGVCPEELQRLVNICQAEGLIDERENSLLHRMVDLGDMRVSELMVPRVDVVAFDLASDRGELVELIQANRLMRIPAYEGHPDNIKGLISARDCLLNPHLEPAQLLGPVQFIPEQARVEALLQHFRTTGRKLAVVVDEYGGLAGIVALEDVVEEIVGEFHAADEPLPLPSVRRLDDTSFVIDAGMDVEDFYRAFRLPAEELRINTVAGLIAAKLDRVPRPGDSVEVGPARLTVASMRRHRVLQARLALPEPPEANRDLARLLEGTPGGRGDSPGGAGGEAT